MPPTAGREKPSPASPVGWGETETSFRESVPRRRKETPMSATLTAAQPGRAGLPQPDLLPRVGKGGHFAAWEEPELFATEMRAAFSSLRTNGRP